MSAREYVLTAVFAVHLVVFAVLYARRRQHTLLLPIAVFALLIATQLAAGRPIARGLRTMALVLAVPSLGLMALRIGRRVRGRRGA